MSPQTSIELRVRYSECDPQNVAHHGAFVPWLEMARIELLRTLGVTYHELESRGVCFVVTGLSIRYRRPARNDDVLTVHVREERRTRVRIDHAYEIRRGAPGSDELLADATTTIACVDRAGKPMAIPDGALGPTPARPA